MSLEELKKKANNGEIKLEDLSVEDILKFLQEGFLNPVLEENFNLSSKEVARIRRQKKLNDAEFENLVRNIIIFYDYFLKKYNFSREYFYNEAIIPMIAGFGSALGKETWYLKRGYEIDWLNMDIKQEILSRKIDVEYRMKQNKRVIESLDTFFSSYIDRDEISEYQASEFAPRKYVPKKTKRSEIKKRQVSVVYRNPKITENALKRANYKCECNPAHETFIRKKDYTPYMEGHHLIPLDYQNLFEYSLDVEANIICLCSNCHKKIHYGINSKEMIEKFYYERREDLETCGINIDIEDLFKLYEKEYDKEEIIIGEYII